MLSKSLAALLFALACGTPALAQQAPTLVEAHNAYYLEQYDRSLAIYQQLAASGNAEAAERAGFMLFQGDGFYGSQIKRDVDRATALFSQAAKAGRSGAGFMLNMIDHFH